MLTILLTLLGIISSIISGVMIIVILMLYSIVADIMHEVGLRKDHQYVLNEEEEN